MRCARIPVTLLSLLAFAPAPVAAADQLEQITLEVGKPKLWSPGYACMMIVCDDPSVVRVEDARTRLRLVGLRPGKTRCGFWRDQTYRRVIRFVVKR